MEANFQTVLIVLIIVYIIGWILSQSIRPFQDACPGVTTSRKTGIVLKWISAILIILMIIYGLYKSA